jgi:hypothetical protein
MPDFIEQQHDFSLVLGGPTFQFFRRTHLEGDHVELLRRRVTVITLLVWLPLLLLSVNWRTGVHDFPFCGTLKCTPDSLLLFRS